jgi:hypothetical protein
MCCKELAGSIQSQTLGQVALRPIKVVHRKSPVSCRTIIRRFEHEQGFHASHMPDNALAINGS